ncbi:MAG: fimbrillin family protein [Muribaculaceae bacterium]|nr:fimbrillin family protein [Muribaculaceae bacterium]
MKYYIRHIILPLLVGMVCVSSCTSDPDPVVSDYEKGEEMTFEVDAATRAIVTDNDNITDRPFMIFGDVNRTGAFFSGLKVFFNHDQVSYNNGKWNYGAKQYWMMGQEHSFVAIHPYDVLKDLKELKYEDSKVSFTYQLPEKDIDMAQDLLVAAHRRIYTLDNGGPIRFKFTHLLSSINIMPALDEVLMYEDEDEKELYPDNKDEYILFQKIEMVGIRTLGTFSFAPGPLGSGNSTNECAVDYHSNEDGGTTVTFDYKDKPIAVTNNKENVSIFDNNKAAIILPQSFDKNSASEIRLYYSVNDDNVVRTIKIPLKNITWEMGKNYTYKFTIEKAYTGQIKSGSFTIDIDDPQHESDEHDDAWVWDGETIDFIFDQESYEDEFK